MQAASGEHRYRIEDFGVGAKVIEPPSRPTASIHDALNRCVLPGYGEHSNM
jgi:hypothetical protein